MLRTLKSEFFRTAATRGFILAAAVTAALCFTVQIFYNSSNGKTYSVFEAIFSIDREIMLNNADFNPAIIISKALSGYSAMALPVTSAFPFVFAFISERNSKNMRFVISRTGRAKYYCSKFAAAVICGELCTMLGVLLFALTTVILFPGGQPAEMLADYLPNGALPTVVKKALSAFIYGAASVLPAFFLCSFCTNPYIILCVPFLLRFILETLFSEIINNAVSAGITDIYEKIYPFQPSSLSFIFDIRESKTLFTLIAVNVIIAAAVFAGFSVIMEKRADRGC